MTETRRTKDWITPEILEKSHQQHQMMAREAIDTSDNVGVPIAEAQSMLDAFVPDAKDIVSLVGLFDKRFFKLFFVGIGLSGLLMLFTIGVQRYSTADKTDWCSLYNAGRSLVWTRNYDEAQKCFEAGLKISYIDNAERSCLYGELAKLAERRGDKQSQSELQLLEKQFSQFGSGLVTILIASIMLFIVAVSTVLVTRKDREKAVIGWHQPAVVCIATYAISVGIHQCAPYIPWLIMTMIASAATFVVLVFSAACDGSGQAHFVTPSRD